MGFEAHSDGEVVAAVLVGERDRFVEIVQRYQGALYRLAFQRLGDADWAEDVVQETFLCAFKSLHAYKSQFSFRTWLWTILLNQCRRQWQQRSKRASQLPVENGDRLTEQTDERVELPVEGLLQQERDARLRKWLFDLPTNQADALQLRFFAGLKFHEIAQVMGCSLSSAENRVRWGLQALSQKMQDQPLAPE